MARVCTTTGTSQHTRGIGGTTSRKDTVSRRGVRDPATRASSVEATRRDGVCTFGRMGPNLVVHGKVIASMEQGRTLVVTGAGSRAVGATPSSMGSVGMAGRMD